MTSLGFDVIILGAPAAGKDTQADLLRKRYGFMPVESGKYLRRRIKRQDAVGRLLARTFARGHAAPVAVIKQFLQDQLRAVSAKQNLLFIGNPRLKPEAQMLTRLLKGKGRDFKVIHISLPEREIRKRSQLRHRDDQDWKYVDNRIKMYRTQVAKTLQYYKQLNKLATVNGDQSIPAVSADIRKIIDDYQNPRTTQTAPRKRAHPSKHSG